MRPSSPSHRCRPPAPRVTAVNVRDMRERIGTASFLSPRLSFQAASLELFRSLFSFVAPSEVSVSLSTLNHLCPVRSLFTYVESVRKLHFQEQEHQFMRRREGVDKTKKVIFLPRGGTYVNAVCLEKLWALGFFYHSQHRKREEEQIRRGKEKKCSPMRPVCELHD